MNDTYFYHGVRGHGARVAPPRVMSVITFGSLGRSPGRAVVQPPALASALASALAKC